MYALYILYRFNRSYFFLFVDGSLSAIKEINVVILDVNDHAPGTGFF